MQDTQHQRHFNEHSFWNKLKRYARKAGREVIETALTLYYCAKDSDTPRWAKTAILSARVTLSSLLIPFPMCWLVLATVMTLVY
ncbi:hypothetical protein VCRA2122O128_80091 [Vibrio crassostreae]|nr:hypothetical protein VCRA2114E121_80091 [Vibrio crassostreae]CAK3688851.1 hypothetical protein VCRA2122O128_80091 [Vibrio crassostreae]